ncbi:flagellar FliJ family protein [Helicobacter pametensis]|uniref:flagellar FliJ family protein n=1 Tax=Helicobacter pametensis TaxID=95149 RepID=UPI0004880FD7|nr:flagellar FliJ family protein [Helicobacter pametensis]
MKTKFDDLIKVSEQKIRLADQMIAALMQRIAECEERVADLLHQMQEIDLPKEGSLALFCEFNQKKKSCLDWIEMIYEEIATIKQEKKQREAERMGYQIELEKLRFLQQKELKAVLETLKKKEQRVLDEIASVRAYQIKGESI